MIEGLDKGDHYQRYGRKWGGTKGGFLKKHGDSKPKKRLEIDDKI